jgi:hypothetical protein
MEEKASRYGRVKVKEKVSLCFNSAPSHERVLGKYMAPHILDLGTGWR